MKIHNRIETIRGVFEIEYQNAGSFNNLPLEKCTQAYGVCYYQNKIVLCKDAKGIYILPGGTIEEGENLEETLIREVKEESNMDIISYAPIGYQKVWNDTTEPFFQVRYYANVESSGPFISDPAGHIVAIELVPEDMASKLLGWGDVGDELIRQAHAIHYSKK